MPTTHLLQTQNCETVTTNRPFGMVRTQLSDRDPAFFCLFALKKVLGRKKFGNQCCGSPDSTPWIGNYDSSISPPGDLGGLRRGWFVPPRAAIPWERVSRGRSLSGGGQTNRRWGA